MTQTDAASPPPALVALAAARRTVLTDLLASATPPFSADYVHDLRVAARRLTEVLGILETLMAKPAARAVDDSLRDLRQGAGALRDLDVLEEHLHKWRFPRPVTELRGRILAELPGRRQALAAGLSERLAAPSLAGALVLLARTLEQAASPASAAEAVLAAALDKRIARRRKQLGKRFGQACLQQSPAALHQARIAVKKLRYALELSHEASHKAKGLKRELQILKGLQKLLGDMHDTDVIVATLEARLQDPPVRRLRGLRRAWNTWLRRTRRRQTRRAVRFFGQAYQWLNSPQGAPRR